MGSSSSKQLLGAYKAAAKQARTCHPPENSFKGRLKSSFTNPSPLKMALARAVALCAPKFSIRSNTSARRSPEMDGSCDSFSKAVSSLSAANTKGRSFWEGSAMSCATVTIWVPREISIFPPSGENAPIISLKRVLFPQPFWPTRPTFCPSCIITEVSSNKARRPKWKERFLMSIIT